MDTREINEVGRYVCVCVCVCVCVMYVCMYVCNVWYFKNT
jgi:hypothetical protein